jgi:hypothetical protein
VTIGQHSISRANAGRYNSAMKALTVCQPWAWGLIHGPKRIENRTRRTHYRGHLLIHAGKSRKWLGGAGDLLPGAPADDDLVYGAILGTVRLVDCIEREFLEMWLAGRNELIRREAVAFEIVAGQTIAVDERQEIDIRFAGGPFCLICLEPRPFRKPIPWAGKLGMFDVPDSVIPDEILTVGPNGIWAN